MSKRFRWSGWVASAAVLIFTCVASAEEPTSSLPSEKQVPDSAPDLALEQVLWNWQQAQSKIDRLDARFSYICYDKIFSRAEIGRGLVSADRNERIVFKLEPDKTPGDSKTVERGGITYNKVPVRNEKWHWTGSSIIKVDDSAREFESIPISIEDQARAANPRPVPPPLPEDVSPPKSARQPAKILPASHKSWSAYWSAFLLQPYWVRPFLLDNQPSELRSRYMITLTKQSAKEVWLEFEPQFPVERAQFKRAFLILDLNNYNPKALKFEDNSGHRSTVFVLSDVRINQPPTDPFGDLGEPDLKGYKRLLHP